MVFRNPSINQHHHISTRADVTAIELQKPGSIAPRYCSHNEYTCSNHPKAELHQHHVFAARSQRYDLGVRDAKEPDNPGLGRGHPKSEHNRIQVAYTTNGTTRTLSQFTLLRTQGVHVLAPIPGAESRDCTVQSIDAYNRIAEPRETDKPGSQTACWLSIWARGSEKPRGAIRMHHGRTSDILLVVAEDGQGNEEEKDDILVVGQSFGNIIGPVHNAKEEALGY
ncbi:hypothetical protein PVAG01_01353 [Phlyctema vagabunda]|uniref:Uncharacterized protein n=1 Tax=Phlyctema vagabunda TaxID=108571 RepID=A0ABR4PWV1_9HELO